MSHRDGPDYPLTDQLLPALVRLALRKVEPEEPIDTIVILVKAWTWDPCACMSPQNGDPLCPCRMNAALQVHLLRVLHEINPEAAQAVMRRRIIAALGGSAGVEA